MQIITRIPLLLSRVSKSTPDQETFLRDLQMLTAFLRNLRDIPDCRTFRGEFVAAGREIPKSLCRLSEQVLREGPHML